MGALAGAEVAVDGDDGADVGTEGAFVIAVGSALGLRLGACAGIAVGTNEGTTVSSRRHVGSASHAAVPHICHAERSGHSVASCALTNPASLSPTAKTTCHQRIGPVVCCY